MGDESEEEEGKDREEIGEREEDDWVGVVTTVWSELGVVAMV
jgi:hypothetical protein